MDRVKVCCLGEAGAGGAGGGLGEWSMLGTLLSPSPPSSPQRGAGQGAGGQ